MSRLITHRRLPLVLALVAAVLLLAAGCAKEPRRPVGALDTPDHHTLRGHDFIEQGRWDEAKRSFDLALSLDKTYSPALAGKAIVVAHEAAAPGMDPDEKEDKAEQARDLVKEALSEAKNDDESRGAHVAGIRVYRETKLPADEWLDDARDHYDEAIDLDERGTDPEPPFYMARAYRDAFQLQQAQDLYRKVLGMNTPLTGKADSELALVQKIIRAEPGSRHGRVVAFQPTLSRADVAALFVEELRLDRLYQRGSRKQYDTGFKPPPSSQTQFQADRLERAPEAVDIGDHPLRADIEEVMKLGVVGLEPDPSHMFHPDEPVNRAEFAMMVEDILVKVTGEEKLKTRFIGQNSPFPDVRNDVPYFNAVMTTTSRDLMEPKDKINGVFAPLDPVTGADALLVIRLLKDELRSYVR